MTIETDLERALRLTRLAEGPLEQFRKQQEEMDRLVQSGSAVTRLMTDLENNSTQRIMKQQLEQINRQSALIDAAQKVMATPAIFGHEER